MPAIQVTTLFNRKIVNDPPSERQWIPLPATATLRIFGPHKLKGHALFHPELPVKLGHATRQDRSLS
jgi:hypothetical protein